MANDVTTLPNMAVSTKFATQKVEDDLSAGIQSGFGLIGYRGKVWSTRYKGESRDILRADGSGPENSIYVVLLKAPSAVSKIYYAGKYVEGSNAAPDCYSTNGVTPAADAAKKQATTCALCPNNQWGSKITDAGKKGKACSDSKRLAIVPANPSNISDPEVLRNALLGGPMLLRVPAASLSDLGMYGKRFEAAKTPYYSYVTKVSFVVNSPYPQFHFEPVRPLFDDEADVVLELRDSALVTRILSEDAVEAEPAPAQPAVFQAPPVQTPVAAANAPALPTTNRLEPVAPSAAAPASAQPVVQPAPATNGAAGVAVPADLEARLDALLSS